MRESDTYQAILDEGRQEGWEEGREEGRVDELHRTLLRLGRRRFGEADEGTRQAVCAIQDLERLEELTEHLLDVSSWEELLE